MLELFKKILNIRISRQNQIIVAVLALCLLIYILLSSLINLNNNVSNLKKENAITISRIEFLAAIREQEITSKSAFSSNFASSVNSSARDNELKIDRTLPLSNNEISIWINESNFIDLFNWLLEINNNGVEISKMSIRRISKETVSAQLTFKS
ncbi:MAG: type II secretion system protein GspM [Gammaproteobacteria bacterium]